MSKLTKVVDLVLDVVMNILLSIGIAYVVNVLTGGYYGNVEETWYWAFVLLTILDLFK